MRLQKYINKEVLLSSLAITSVLLLIFTSQQFVRFLGDAVDGKITSTILFKMVSLQIPPLLGFLIPLAVFLSVLITFGRMTISNELVVARSIGVGDRHFARMLAPLIGFLMALTGFFSLWVAPWSAMTQQSILKEQDKASEFSFLTPGRFQQTRDGRSIILVSESSKKGVLGQLFLATLPDEENKEWFLVSALNATSRQHEESGQQEIVLNNGVNYRFSTETSQWSISEFEHYFMRLPKPAESKRKDRLRAVSTVDLLSEQSPQNWSEFHWRLSIPISIPLLILLAIPLSKVQPRQGKFGKMLPAMLLYLAYIIFTLVFRDLIEKEKVSGLIGMFWVHGAFALYVVWQYRIPHRKLKLKQKLVGSSKEETPEC